MSFQKGISGKGILLRMRRKREKFWIPEIRYPHGSLYDE